MVDSFHITIQKTRIHKINNIVAMLKINEIHVLNWILIAINLLQLHKHTIRISADHGCHHQVKLTEVLPAVDR